MESLETGVRCFKRLLRPINRAVRKTTADHLQAKAQAEKGKRKETVLQTLGSLLKPK